MTTTLATIKAAVAAHFAAYETGTHFIHQHAAMLMLRDLLPLLQAAVAWDTLNSSTSFDDSVDICNALGNEVAKLLAPTSAPSAASGGEAVAIDWPPSPKRCECNDFSPSSEDSFRCEKCNGLKF